MKLVKIKCIRKISAEFTPSYTIYRMSDFTNEQVQAAFDMYIDVEYILNVSDITYKTIQGNRYYGYKVVMKNGVTFWIKTSGPKVYDYIAEYIPDQVTNVPIKKSGHLNIKLRKND